MHEDSQFEYDTGERIETPPNDEEPFSPDMTFTSDVYPQEQEAQGDEDLPDVDLPCLGEKPDNPMESLDLQENTWDLLETRQLAPREIATELLTPDKPSVHRVAELIEHGLTEEMILEAAMDTGLQVPDMELTLTELDNITTYYLDRVSDALAAKAAGSVVICADRDADLLYYNFAIRHPETECHLMPASSSLWFSASMDDPELAGKFLSRYGMSRERVEDPAQKFYLADAGFSGGIGRQLDQRLAALYGSSLVGNGQMRVGLVCARKGSQCEQILDIDGMVLGPFPKLRAWLGDGAYNSDDKFSSTYRLAAAMNLMPRHRDVFTHLVQSGDEVKAVSRNYRSAVSQSMILDHFRNTVDMPYCSGADHNASVVNPVAAAIVQYRTIKAAIASRDKGRPRV